MLCSLRREQRTHALHTDVSAPASVDHVLQAADTTDFTLSMQICAWGMLVPSSAPSRSSSFAAHQTVVITMQWSAGELVCKNASALLALCACCTDVDRLTALPQLARKQQGTTDHQRCFIHRQAAAAWKWRTCLTERARRMARVFLARRSSGITFLFFTASRTACRWFWLITVSTHAMFLRTVLLHDRYRVSRRHEAQRACVSRAQHSSCGITA